MKIFSSAASETDDVGIADNDIDGFLKNLLPSVTREAAQNSNDEAKERPVKMSFEMLEIFTSEIPDFEEYKYVISQCYEDSRINKSKKGQEFFENAKNVIAREKVSVLKISDRGTKGAGGEFAKGGKFYTLVVSKGRTDKDNVYSAGSFGIGKNAAFAGSELRCVFYSSRFGKGNEFYCMGKSILTSWAGKTGQNMSHKVFFGAESEALRPEGSISKLPRWLQKEEQGLSVSILAPRIELREGWVHGYVASLISNFFLAIYDGDLEFSLDKGSVVLSPTSMYQYFIDENVVQSSQQSGDFEKFSMAKSCVEGLVAGDFISEIVNVENLGEFDVSIRVEEGLPKKVCFIRNGMFITDTLNHFGKPLLRFPNTQDFIVMVRPRKVDDSSSEAIKRMENPEHSELTTSYIADEAEVKSLNKAMLELEIGIRRVITKHAKLEVLESVSIDELREFFPGDDEETQSHRENEDDPSSVCIESMGVDGFKGDKSFSPGERSGTPRHRVGPRSVDPVDGRPLRPSSKRNSKGAYRDSALGYRSVRVGRDREWRISFTSIPSSGVIELWPEEEPRSGRDAKQVKVVACSALGAELASDGLSVRVPVTSIESGFLTVEIDRDVGVISMRPVIKESKDEV